MPHTHLVFAGTCNYYHIIVTQGSGVDVHGLADGLKALVEAGCAQAAGQSQQSDQPFICQTLFQLLGTPKLLL